MCEIREMKEVAVPAERIDRRPRELAALWATGWGEQGVKAPTPSSSCCGSRATLRQAQDTASGCVRRRSRHCPCGMTYRRAACFTAAVAASLDTG